jgi:hypothetical protein
MTENMVNQATKMTCNIRATEGGVVDRSGEAESSHVRKGSHVVFDFLHIFVSFSDKILVILHHIVHADRTLPAKEGKAGCFI